MTLNGTETRYAFSQEAALISTIPTNNSGWSYAGSGPRIRLQPQLLYSPTSTPPTATFFSNASTSLTSGTSMNILQLVADPLGYSVDTTSMQISLGIAANLSSSSSAQVVPAFNLYYYRANGTKGALSTASVNTFLTFGSALTTTTTTYTYGPAGINSVVIQAGDRLVLEVGVYFNTGGGSASSFPQILTGYSGGGDALSGFSQGVLVLNRDLSLGKSLNNYARVVVGNGMSASLGF